MSMNRSAAESVNYTECLIDAVDEPLVSLNRDLRVVAANRPFYQIFDAKPMETLGRVIFDLGNEQWNTPGLRKLLDAVIRHKTTFGAYELERDFEKIGRRVMHLNARPLNGARGRGIIVLLSIEDITRRRSIERKLLQAHEKLSALSVELRYSAAVKAEFLANMSHALWTPLNSINGFSEVLSDEIFGPLNAKQKKYINNVLSSGKDLLLLVNKILDIAKIESGKTGLSLSMVPLAKTILEVAQFVEEAVAKKKLQFELELADSLPAIEGDELRIKEIIFNLLANAIDFTPENGSIGLRARMAGQMAEIEVWDKGIGIAPEHLLRLFEDFFRVDSLYSRVTDGIGLGLSLSKKLVELHGGKLSVESEGLNAGTAVRFTLPIISGMAPCLNPEN